MDAPLAFIQKSFGEKRDLSGLLSWQHSERVAEYLVTTANIFDEVDPITLKNLYLGALGHDLLEDTAVQASEIQANFGVMALEYIQAMTNHAGDSDFKDYISSLAHGPEEVLLIKLADIYANATNSITCFEKLGPKWIANFWLPLLLEYRINFFSRLFKRYPQTAQRMIADINIRIEKLQELLSLPLANDPK